MLRPCPNTTLRSLRGGPWRRFAAAPQQKANISNDFLSVLERDNDRLLGAVRKKIEERTRWASQLSPDMNTKQDVSLLKQLHETKKLQATWDKWEANRTAVVEMRRYLEDSDREMREIAAMELGTLEDEMSATLTVTIPKLVSPRSTTKEYGALFEMKSGAGGSESSLFLEELMRVYTRVCLDPSAIPVSEAEDDQDALESRNWRIQVVEENKADVCGIKSAIFEVQGKGAYDVFQFESGVHRVQRIPATDTAGRIHTSTVGVLVMPLVEGDKPVEDLYKLEDVKIEVMRARGAGGQHVNKTESAVRLTHLPTGITVAMQDERSQHQNKRAAFRILSSRLLDRRIQQEQVDAKNLRKNLVKSYDRSEKIRTYNWPQARVTDHRIGFSSRQLEKVMEEDGIIDFLVAMRKDWENGKMEEILAA